MENKHPPCLVCNQGVLVGGTVCAISGVCVNLSAPEHVTYVCTNPECDYYIFASNFNYNINRYQKGGRTIDVKGKLKEAKGADKAKKKK